MGHAETKIQEAPRASAYSMEEYWMPFTPNRDFKHDPKMVVRAEGMYLWNERGERLIDASSGLFCVNAGHCRKEIADAVSTQLRELDFIAPFTRGHPKQFELARRVAEMTPGDLNRIFFTNSGSEAVDTAMKIALAYWQAKGQGGRTMFVSRERAYHGVNFGGVSLAGMANNRRRFGPTLPGIAHMRHTHIKENFFQPGEGNSGVELAEDLVRFINLYGAENIAACFVEPIAGSTGCLVPPKGYLKRLREICDAHSILLVFDEVITGFGRTGQTFAAQSFGVTPDLMTMAKGITNGAQPMGAVAASERIYDAIVAASGRRHRVFPWLYVLGPSGAMRRWLGDARYLSARRFIRAGPRAGAVFSRGFVLFARRAGCGGYSRLRSDWRGGRADRRGTGPTWARVAEEAVRQRIASEGDRRFSDRRAAIDCRTRTC